MRLLRLELTNLQPFGALNLDFRDDKGRPRGLMLCFGGPGTGKSRLLKSIASTRPGLCQNLILSLNLSDEEKLDEEYIPLAATEWLLGCDEPSRPHPLRVISPNSPSSESTAMLRREMILFDKLAKERGFVVIGIAGHRWFGRQTLYLGSPKQSFCRYEPRNSCVLEENTPTDLTRDCNQLIAYSFLCAGLAQSGLSNDPSDRSPMPQSDISHSPTQSIPAELSGIARYASALKEAIDHLLAPFHCRLFGIDPLTWEARFERYHPSISPNAEARRDIIDFSQLSHAEKILVSYICIPFKTLLAAYQGEDPRLGEALILLDDAELGLPEWYLPELAPRLKQALPAVQWLLTTSSAELASAQLPGELFSLRKESGNASTLYEDGSAVTH